MADSILSSLLSKSALTIVKSAGSDNLAKNLKISSVDIKYTSRAMRHMKEDGNTIVDARIIGPVQLSIDVICQSLDELKVINDILTDRENTYTVSSKGLVFQNMVSESAGIKQSAEMLTASPIKFELKELRKMGGSATGRVVEQAPDSSVFPRGIHTLSAETRPVTDTFNKAIGTALPSVPNIPVGIPLP